MKKRAIAVLFGGCSGEYEVSLQSAHAILRHIDLERYMPVPLGITREGGWYHFTGNVDRILEDAWLGGADCIPALLSPCRERGGVLELHAEGIYTLRIDAAFPALHGRNGEDGTVQGLLELAGIPCVGCGSLASALCMDKAMAHTVAAAADIPAPKGYVLQAPGDTALALEAARELGYPLFVKPVRAGSSLGVACVHTPEALEEAVQDAFAYDSRVLLEERITGVEVGCAILGRGDTIVTGLVDEVEIAGEYYAYTEKYNAKQSRVHLPARADNETHARIRQAALQVYTALGCEGCARVDLFLTPQNEIFFNEVNTMPGFTAHSRFPNMLKAAGMGFGELVNRLIEEVLCA